MALFPINPLYKGGDLISYLDRIHFNKQQQQQKSTPYLNEEAYQYIKPLVTKVFKYRLIDFIKKNEPEINLTDLTVGEYRHVDTYGIYILYNGTINEFLFKRDGKWYHQIKNRKNLHNQKDREEPVTDKYMNDFIKLLKDGIETDN